MSNPIPNALVTAHLLGESITEQRHGGMYSYFTNRVEDGGGRVPKAASQELGKFTVGYANLGANMLEVEVAVPNAVVAALMPTDGLEGAQEMGLVDVIIHKGMPERGAEPDELAYLSFMYLSTGKVALRAIDIPSTEDSGVSAFLQSLQLDGVTNSSNMTFPMPLDEAQTRGLAQHVDLAA